MTEEKEVVNARGGEISDNGGDHSKIKADHCNGVVRAKEDEINGNVGAKADAGESVDVADSDSPDPFVVVHANGSVTEEDGESVVTVTEGERVSEAVNGGTGETTTVDVVEREGEGESGNADGENGSGSLVVLGDEKKDATDELKNGVSVGEPNEIREDVAVSVAENEIHDDVDVSEGVVAVEEGVADVNKSDRELEAVQNGDVEEIAVPVVVDGESVVDSDVQGRSESVSDKAHETLPSENVVGEDENVVGEDEKRIVTNGSHSVKLADSEPVESAEDSEIPVVGSVDGLVSGTAAVKEGLEKEQALESVSDVDADIQNGSAQLELSERAEENTIPVEGELERSGEESTGPEVVHEADMIGDGNGVSDMNGNAVESVGEPSVDLCEMKNNAVENEGEPSNNAVKSEGEPSDDVSETTNNAVENEAEPSNNALDSEAESSNKVVEGEAEPSSDAVENGVEPSINALERDAEPSNDAMENGIEPSINEVDIDAEPSNDAVVNGVEPSVNAVERKAEPSNDAVVNGVEPSDNSVEREAEPSNNPVENEVEPSKNAVEGEADPSSNAVEGEAEPSKDAVECEAEPSSNAVGYGAEPSKDATEDEAEPSTDVVERECEPSNNVAEFEAEPSNNVVQNEAEPSVDVPDLKTKAGESEAEPSVEVEASNCADEDARPAQEGSSSTTDTLDGLNMGTEVVRKPFYYLIRLPRYDDDENMKEQIKNVLNQVAEKTKIRDTIRAETHIIKASCKEYNQEFRAAISEERAARDLLKSKRQEMDSVQSTMNRLNNAISVGDIDGKIRNMEHMIQHETLPLKEEKQLIRQIKLLKQNREELSANMAKQDQSNQSLDDKDSIEEQFKQSQLLKKEMELLRNNVLKSEAATKAARKKYDEECNKLSELQAQYKAADDNRQEAYVKLQALRKQLHGKSKYFYEYKDAVNKGQELAVEGKKEELQSFCVDQVEKIMELWNKNDEFRRDYLRCNTRSTLRRLQTLDGRALGPGEEPPVIPNAFTERAFKTDSLVSQSTLQQEKKPAPTESVKSKDEPVKSKDEPVKSKDELVSKAALQKTETSQAAKAKKPAKPAPSVVAAPRWGDESDEDTIEKPVRTKEEEELILKAEMARKEEEAAKLKEMRRLEEIEKAKEALQRKKRNAEKAQQRAALKAQREAEQKEKEREKRAKKKEKRKTTASTDAVVNTEQEPAPSSETLSRTSEESDQVEKPVEVTKRSLKPSQFTKQTKVKPLPMAIRNRGKRRLQPWMWVVIAVLAVVALFLVGNNSSLRFSLHGFGF